MKKLFIASPFRGKSGTDRINNIAEAKALGLQAIQMGFLPIIPHLYFPQFLNDADVQDRGVGIALGVSLMLECDAMVVFDENGISEGMALEMAFWKIHKNVEPMTWNELTQRVFKKGN